MPNTKLHQMSSVNTTGFLHKSRVLSEELILKSKFQQNSLCICKLVCRIWFQPIPSVASYLVIWAFLQSWWNRSNALEFGCNLSSFSSASDPFYHCTFIFIYFFVQNQFSFLRLRLTSNVYLQDQFSLFGRLKVWVHFWLCSQSYKLLWGLRSPVLMPFTSLGTIVSSHPSPDGVL